MADEVLACENCDEQAPSECNNCSRDPDWHDHEDDEWWCNRCWNALLDDEQGDTILYRVVLIEKDNVAQ
jgi:hypothetical protein